jgi:transcriptional regulator with XRE-family HTH domain
MSEQRHPTGAVNHLAGGLSRKEVAAIMGISKNRVQQIESRALAKLRRNPLLRHLAAECGIATEDVKP